MSGSDLRRVSARTWLLQATWNYERQQGLGWAWCLAPVIERLYADPQERYRRLAEHTAFFNTQPTLASMALGAVAKLEEQRSAVLEAGPPDAAAQLEPDHSTALDSDDGVTRVKMVLGSALAALGDRLFWFTLRPFAAVVGVLLALGGSWSGALAMWMCYNAVHLTLRHRGVAWGYRQGPAVLSHGLRERLEGLVSALAQVGTALVGVLVASLLLPGGEPQSLAFQMLLGGGLALGLLTARQGRPSPTHYGVGFGALCLIVAWWR